MWGGEDDGDDDEDDDEDDFFSSDSFLNTLEYLEGGLPRLRR